jgi:hypothetical protein
VVEAANRSARINRRALRLTMSLDANYNVFGPCPSQMHLHEGIVAVPSRGLLSLLARPSTVEVATSKAQ